MQHGSKFFEERMYNVNHMASTARNVYSSVIKLMLVCLFHFISFHFISFFHFHLSTRCIIAPIYSYLPHKDRTFCTTNKRDLTFLWSYMYQYYYIPTIALNKYFCHVINKLWVMLLFFYHMPKFSDSRGFERDGR